MKKYISVVITFACILILAPSIAVFSDLQDGSDNPANTSQSESPVAEISQADGLENSIAESVTEQEVSENDKLQTNPEVFRVLQTSSGQVKEVSVRDYVIGAVCAEMPASFETEALKAQAVACHTYAVRRQMKENSSPDTELKGADFSDDSSKYQAYFTADQIKSFYGEKYEEYYSKVCLAVDEVLNEILVYDNQPAVTAFHSMSSGFTESAENVWGYEIPYLVPVSSTEDMSASQFEETVDFTASELFTRFTLAYPDIRLEGDKSGWIKINKVSDSGTVLSMTVGNKEISGLEFRSVLSLKSACFSVSCSDEKISVTTKGYGHGVGMSQYGANEMAKGGKTYREILAHYYKGTKLLEIQ